MKKIQEKYRLGADLTFFGMDEAGRGPWAGPVVCCAILLPKNLRLKGLNDSKLLSAPKRDQLYEILSKKALFGVGISTAAVIDKKGIIKSTNLAYNKAYSELINKVAQRDIHILIDGRDKFKLPTDSTSIIKGDMKVRIIAAASVVAKVVRDRMMVEYSKKYPNYAFDLHKGYGTQKHQSALKEFGPCQIHRKSFRPISDMN